MSALSVFRPHRFAHLLQADSRNISRDPTLIFAISLAIVPTIAFAIWRDPIDIWALSTFGLSSFTGYVTIFLLSLPAFLIGWVTGFLFLDDRDDGVLTALDVSPVGKQGFFAYRISITALVSILITLLTTSLLLPQVSLPMALFFAILIALEAVCVAFILPAVARNKVEGLAVTKLTNIAAIAPLLVLIPSPWRMLIGIVPTYWLGELLHLSPTNYLPDIVLVALAIASHVLAAALLYFLVGRRKG